MSDSPVINVNIFGTDYKIATDTDVEYTRKVARYVDVKMREVAHSLSLRSAAKIAVLTAINLADELRRERDVNRSLDESTRSTANRLAETVDGGVGQGKERERTDSGS